MNKSAPHEYLSKPRRTTWSVVVVVSALLVSVAALADVQAHPPMDTNSEMSLQSRVDKARRRAAESPTIQEEQRRIQGLIDKAVIEKYPSLKADLARSRVLNRLLLGREVAPSTKEREAWVEEARDIATRLHPAQNEAMSTSSIAVELKGFENKMRAEMEKDPQVKAAIESLEKQQVQKEAPTKEVGK